MLQAVTVNPKIWRFFRLTVTIASAGFGQFSRMTKEIAASNSSYANTAFLAKEHHFRGQSLLFVPINEKSVALFERYFTFAELGEDPLFLKPGRDEHDAVYQLPSNDDPDDVFEEISPDIKGFLNEPGFTGGLNQRD